ncbi:hypothetical protein GCM10023094_29320 [Rhodococcus olei]|uniref:Tocopherol cyclase-like protein n=1 Tax=Rhodococcus olei TaxID=2161675 RepID=A0ABP8P398_9NOCA
MTGRRSVAERALSLVNRGASGPQPPVRGPVDLRPPGGRGPLGSRWFNWAHYGVMVPNLPEPHRYFGVMAIVGTPEVSVFANDWAIATTPRDSATVVSSTAAMTDGGFGPYATSRDCEFAADGSVLRFGDDLIIESRHPEFTVRRTHPEVRVDLTLRATGQISRFFDVPGVYRHWSLLCEYEGTVGHAGEVQDVSGLCTLEYARGAGAHSVLPIGLASRAKLPARLFTYHVVNLDEDTQVLLSHVTGPRGIPLLRTAYLRSRDGWSVGYTTGCVLTVERYADAPHRTPDGRDMTLPARFRWRLSADGTELLLLECTAGGDWTYGLGAGYVGSFRFEGHHRGREVTGLGYAEYVDVR